MTQTPMFDFHTHAFPDRIAARTMAHLAVICGTTPTTDGTASGLLHYCEQHGFARCLLQQIATKPSQQHTVNNWAAQLQEEYEMLFAFGSIHPDAPDWEAELERIQALGLKGVKLHPDYQQFHTDEERMRPIYHKLAELGLPVLFHGGYDPMSPNDVHNPPAAMAQVLRWEPELTVIDAHLGDMVHPAETLAHLAGKDIVLDLSMSVHLWQPKDLKALFERHDPEKIVFGSDCPWGDPQAGLGALRALGLPKRTMDLVLWENACRLLKL